MDNCRPLILIVNDDGVDAPGVNHLAECVRSLGEVYIVAPDSPQSGKSAAMTVKSPLRVIEKDSKVNGIRIFTVNGTPVDCVKMAIHTIVPRRPTVVLAGINHGTNFGVNITYSGTMGAVLEGCIEGIPSVGFSLANNSLEADFSPFTEIVVDIACEVITNGLPEGICLNVNIPSCDRPKGIRVCRAVRGKYIDGYMRYSDPDGIPFYWLTGIFENFEPEATDTDKYWLKQNYISIVPVKCDLSAKNYIKYLSKRFNAY